MLTLKQRLILFLISSEPGINDIRKLVTIFDRFDFPAEMGFNLKTLLENDFIFVSETLYNGTPRRYQITNKGRKELDDTFDADEILGYFDSLDKPNSLFEITKKYVDKRINNNI